MRIKALYIIIYTLLLSINIFAQKTKDRSGFSYGGGFGAMMASGKNALFYNGAPDKPNSIVAVIGNPIEDINSIDQSKYSQLYSVLKDDIIGIQYPSKMSYNPAITLHGYLAYIFESQNSIYGQLKYSSCVTNGVFSLTLASPDTSSFNNSANKIVEGGIKAKESRVDIEFGYRILLNKENKIVPFLDLFVNINTVAVKSHDINITTSNGTFTSSIIQRNISNQFTTQPEGGTGYGFGTTIGIEAPLKEKMYYNIGLQGSMKTIHLLDNATLTPHFDLFARVLF